ncbi:basic leucine-zipper 42 [Perilla frutescens var. hirtella]|uniref:Basic leucine-zipper 42 n=1 Tax=Perilla frutescens var. hirtella TaxID=608512 RepID=A0AAD4PA72_PERFH|nr:basic leucine-zipper 42 [Perilla frutescens var. frutescens]KAH6831670.1 basic leucine-zipper 42 [Perilla frutescens var. hirtella]
MSYFGPAANPPSIFQGNFNLPAVEVSRFLIEFPNYEEVIITPNSSCISNNSTSDEAEEHQFISSSILDERKQRRMISNRESARRSRMRKQRHLDELWSQVLRLRTENHNLIEKLNEASETHDRVLQENVRLKEEAAQLHTKLMDLQLTTNSDSYSIFTHLHSSNHSLTPSQDLLH